MQEHQMSESMFILISDLGVLVDRRWTATLAPYGITPAEFRILSLLVSRGSLNARDIAESVPIDPSFISRMVQRLVEKSLIYRRRSTVDRRQVTLRHTAAGAELVSDIEQAMENMESELVDRVSAANLRRTKSAILSMTENIRALEDST